MPECQSSGSPFCPHVPHSQGPCSSVPAASLVWPHGVPGSLAPTAPVPRPSGTLTRQGLLRPTVGEEELLQGVWGWQLGDKPQGGVGGTAEKSQRVPEATPSPPQ